MAVFTRINGDAAGVVNVDAGRSFANAVIINTGIAAPLSAYKIVFTAGNLAAELTTGGAVESTLRAVETNATVLAYQVDTGSQLSVICERSGWASDAAVVAAIQGLGTNIGAAGSVPTANVAVSSTGGIKFA
jgi:hypothetical protein